MQKVDYESYDITKEQYIAVLEMERGLLLRNYFKPQNEGTGHFDTAIKVLEHRIQEIRNGTEA
jgi:hypothetical protein